MNRKLSEISLKRLDECEISLIELFVDAINKTPYRFEITCGYRSPNEQAKLYAKGRTAPGNIVTYIDGKKKKGKHNYNPSKAVDIVVYDENNKVTWDEKYYIKIGESIKDIANDLGINIIWGGDWLTFKDYPHFELI